MRRYAILAATLLVATFTFGESCEQLTTIYQFPGTATPTTPMASGGMPRNGLALIADGNGIRAHTGTSELWRARFFCPGSGCPGLIRGDYDWVMYNFSTCNTCGWMIAAGGSPGRQVICQWSAGRPAGCYAVDDEISEGAYVFGHGGSTYAVLDWSRFGCQGPAMVRFRYDGTLGKLACLSLPQNAPQTAPESPPWLMAPEMRAQALAYLASQPGVAGGLRVLNGFRIDASHVAVIFSDGYLRIFAIVGSGDALRLQYVSGGIKGYSHYGTSVAYDPEQKLIASVPNYQPRTTLELWDVSNPADPVMLSLTGDLPCCYTGINYPYVWVGQTFGRDAVVLDITNPRKPVKLPNDIWIVDRGSKRLYTGAIPIGQDFIITAYAFGLGADLSGCDRTIFADGFESGNTSAWSEVRQ